MIEEDFVENVARKFIYYEIVPGEKAVMKFVGSREELEAAIYYLRRHAERLKHRPQKRDIFGHKRRKQLKLIGQLEEIAQTWEDYIENYGYLIG